MKSLELLQLRYFQTVAKYENMTTASKELCVAQPAISQSISRLEEDLGTALFTREGRRIRLNACGKYLFDHVPSILSSLDNLRSELADIAGQSNATVRLKVLSASSMVPGIISEFQQAYPDINFRLIHHSSEPNYDLCLSSAAIKHSGDLVLLDEEILVAVPQSHRYENMDTVSLKALKDEGFISLSKGMTFRAIMDDYCQSVQFEPKIVFESDSPATVRGLVRAGTGIAFWPARSWGLLTEEKVKALHIDGLNARRVITLSAPEGKPISKATAVFSAFASLFFSKL